MHAHRCACWNEEGPASGVGVCVGVCVCVRARAYVHICTQMCLLERGRSGLGFELSRHCRIVARTVPVPEPAFSLGFSLGVSLGVYLRE